MKNMTGPITGLHFIRNNSIFIDKTHDSIDFQHLTMQVKSSASETSAKPQSLFTDDTLTLPSRKTRTITVFVDHPSEWITIGSVTPLDKCTETASLLISRSMSTIIEKKVAVSVTNTTKSPYLIKRNIQIAEFSVVFPEQSKFIKPVEMANLSMILEGDPDLNNYLKELLWPNKKEQENSTFCFQIVENCAKTEDHIPI